MFHLLLGVGICIHLFEILPRLHSPSLLCYYFTPISYGLFLAFIYFVILSSLLSFRLVNKLPSAISFMRKLVIFYRFFTLYCLGIMFSIYTPEYVCNTSQFPKFWPTLWTIAAFLECGLMSYYLSNLISELIGIREFMTNELEISLKNKMPKHSEISLDNSTVHMSSGIELGSFMY